MSDTKARKFLREGQKLINQARSFLNDASLMQSLTDSAIQEVQADLKKAIYQISAIQDSLLPPDPWEVLEEVGRRLLKINTGLEPALWSRVSEVQGIIYGALNAHKEAIE